MEFQPYNVSGQPAVQSVALLHHINHISDGGPQIQQLPGILLRWIETTKCHKWSEVLKEQNHI